MKKLALTLMAALALTTAPALANTHAEVGKPAPAFTATTSNGETLTLASLKGKTVVLEWTNHDCPFVKKFYEPGEMQRLQAEAAQAGVVWVSIISSAPGKQGHVTAEAANKLTADRKASPAHVVLDEAGVIGKAYGAKTTPHMFVINAEGMLVYAGAIDDKPSTKSADIAGAKNYVTAALADIKAGRPVATPSTKAYGCSVKYAD